MKSNKKMFIIACVLGVIAFAANSIYWQDRLSQLRDRRYSTVVKAKQVIRPGMTLSAKLIEPARVPDMYKPVSAIPWDAKDQYLQQEVGSEIPAGDYVLQSAFVSRTAVGRTLSAQLEGQGYRAITIPVDDTNSFARSIVAGDKIDMIFTFQVPALKQKLSTVLLADVPVIATGGYSAAELERGERGGKGGKYNTITLKLPIEDAFRLNYARQAGTISLLLRSARDAEKVQIAPIAGVQDILSATEKERIEVLIQNAVQMQNVGSEKVADQIREQARIAIEQQRRQAQTSGK